MRKPVREIDNDFKLRAKPESTYEPTRKTIKSESPSTKTPCERT